MSDTPAGTLRPVGLTLTGAPRAKRDRLAGARREEGLMLLLLVPAGSLVFAALLIIALSLITASPSSPPDRETSGGDPQAWTGSPVIEEQPGDETPRRPK
jgi:hypothetical protein